MTVLYHYWRSSASYRVRIALNVLDVPYRSVAVDLVAGEQRDAANLARNHQGLVPTLEIDGLVFTQSLAIMEYLDETRGPILLPHGAVARARVRALCYAIAMEIAPVCNLSVRNHAAVISNGAVTADAWQRRYIGQGFAALEEMLDGAGAYCNGDTISMADLCLLPQVYNAQRAGLDMSLYPKIAGIAARLADLPQFAAAHPDQFRPK